MPEGLSVAIICRNSAATIGATLESVRGLADEVVALDSGSTDGTQAILEAAGARVVPVTWAGFGPTKQQATDACSGRWVLQLDSDEALDAGLRASIAERVKQRDGPALAMVNRRTWYAGTPLRHAWQPEWILRLMRRGADGTWPARWTGAEPHAALTPVRTPGAGARSEADAAPVRLAGTLRHDSFATFSAFMDKQLAYSRTSARGLFDAGVRPSRARLVFSPVSAFLKQMILKQAWRDGPAGWLAAASRAIDPLTKHLCLLELWTLYDRGLLTPGPASPRTPPAEATRPPADHA